METEINHVTARTLWCESHAIGHGALLLCLKGHAVVRVDFDSWMLQTDSFVVFYPGDVVAWEQPSADFEAVVLRYSPETLQLASMNMEHEIYHELRNDRVCGYPPLIKEVVKSIFTLLRFYFGDSYTPSFDRIATLQVQTFFTGFADYMRHNPRSPRLQQHPEGDGGSLRVRQLFAHFMHLVEEHFNKQREAAWYAGQLNISPKYLNRITHTHASLSSKRLIDSYVTQRLKLALQDASRSLKEIAADFHFPDQAAMSRYFKAHTGSAPKQYRMS